MYRLVFAIVPMLLLGAQPDARELVRQSADAIKKYRSYQLESLIVVEMRGGPALPTMEMPSSISVRRPDKMRIDSRSRAGSITIVGDGEHTWYYLLPQNQFIKREASVSPEAAVNNSGLMPKSLPDVSQSIDSMKLAGEDSIAIEGKPYPCWKILTTYKDIHLPEHDMTVRDAAQTTWISKAEGLTLQSEFRSKIFLSGSAEPIEMTQSTHTVAVRLNLDLPDSTFVFTAPEGAKETKDWTLPGIAKPDVIGKPVPALSGKALDGAEIDLAALRGKVVLLDFWATWCTPCQRELPNLEKLHKEFQDQGVVVVGMNVGEDRQTVQDFLKSAGLTLPVVPLEENAELIAALSVNAYPTMVVVDREGNIASYEVGVRGEAGLRAELDKLGIHAHDGVSRHEAK
ncbi:MAG TPA: redoxin family protein [Bryobacteraceae bacterium]|nr:redoxin family protein [Bryobacteraceae bacterium]